VPVKNDKAGDRPRLGASSDPSDANPPIPSSPHKAYCHGLETGRRGDDLGEMIVDALRFWPMDTGFKGLAELIACAVVGYVAAETKGGES
jgi:hypothetical protein